jgi:alginate O-acetyltransferase complex protein AlgI
VKEPRFVHYLLFVSYFPHLIAGPVLHHAQMMPQFASSQTYLPSASRFAAGMALFAIGLAKKLLIADPNGIVADRMYADPGAPDFFRAWHGTLSYAFQIYFDFSGYSDMALGLSLLFGIRLPINFDSPYRASSIIDFWRRWHISLSTFLRDYLYVPLGGSRHGSARRYANLMITMVLGGLWHGASWTFVVWGTLHGLYLVLNHLWRLLRGPSSRAGRLERGVGWLLTFLAVCFAWVFFRADSFSDATQILRGMAGLNGLGWGFKGTHGWSYVVGALALVALPWNSNVIAGRIERWRGGRPVWAAVSGLVTGALLMFSVMRIAGGGSPQFLYFQF